MRKWNLHLFPEYLAVRLGNLAKFSTLRGSLIWLSLRSFSVCAAKNCHMLSEQYRGHFAHSENEQKYMGEGPFNQATEQRS